MLIPLWVQRPSARARPPPQAASLPCGWSAAASAQPVPASPGAAGFCPQSTTNTPNANISSHVKDSSVQHRSLGLAFCSTRWNEWVSRRPAGQGQREGDKRRDRMKWWVKGGVGRKWGREHSKWYKDGQNPWEKRRKTSPSPASTCKELSQCLSGFPFRACCGTQCVNTARIH